MKKFCTSCGEFHSIVDRVLTKYFSDDVIIEKKRANNNNCKDAEYKKSFW